MLTEIARAAEPPPRKVEVLDLTPDQAREESKKLRADPMYWKPSSPEVAESVFSRTLALSAVLDRAPVAERVFTGDEMRDIIRATAARRAAEPAAEPVKE